MKKERVARILLIIIYMAFISLGLPDSLLGTAWPAIQSDWQLSLGAAGGISMILVGSTIVSSLLSGRIIARFGTAKITLISCVMTGLALLGFSLAPSYVVLLIVALPLGLGAGSVDAALNHYVALNYKAHHMNWLHSFWGIGATIGPMIMAGSLASLSWRSGYSTISIMQLSLAVVILLTLGIWPKSARARRQMSAGVEADGEKHVRFTVKSALRTKGLVFALAVFMFYCAAELSVGLWGSSYLVQIKHVPASAAAAWIAVYYGGITVGRFVSGFVSFRLSNKKMIVVGMNIALAGVILLAVPLPAAYTIVPLMLIGLGLAPIFPAMIHETPAHFGKQSSGAIIGYQMAFGYMGSAFLPPLIGIIINGVDLVIFPYLLIGAIAVIYFSVYRLYAITRGSQGEVYEN